MAPPLMMYLPCTYHSFCVLGEQGLSGIGARRCARRANDGQCLLIDYNDATGFTNALDHLDGHAAYTRLSNLLFNTNEIVQALYANESSQPPS